MENPLDRFSWVRKKVGLNSKAFAESIGLSASGLHNMYTRKSRVTEVLAYSIELVHGVRSKWLLTGEGLKITEHNKQGKMENESMENESFERLIIAVERCTKEMQIFNRIFNTELKEAEMRVTETINRKAQEFMDAETDPKLFTLGLNEQLRRKNLVN